MNLVQAHKEPGSPGLLQIWLLAVTDDKMDDFSHGLLQFNVGHRWAFLGIELFLIPQSSLIPLPSNSNATARVGL